jgi:uncharacterized protein (UPF0261 family)
MARHNQQQESHLHQQNILLCRTPNDECHSESRLVGAKNLACDGQMFQLRLNMTAHRISCDRALLAFGEGFYLLF